MNQLSLFLAKAKEASRVVANLQTETKNAILSSLQKKLADHRDAILIENAKDIKNAQSQGRNAAFINRLTLTSQTIESMISQLSTIIHQPDPIGDCIEEKNLPNGIKLTKVRVPMGVIAVIYESRPNVTIDVAALCMKSGNVAVLKGGSEAFHTNTYLVYLVHESLRESDIPSSAVTFIESTDRSVTADLIRHDSYIDLLIPRGGYDLARFVVENSTIPLLYHSAGGARVYVDKNADIQKAAEICVNAKTSRPSTCNSLDTVVVHEAVAPKFLPVLEQSLAKQEHNVEVRADEKALRYIQGTQATDADFTTEFLDYILSVKTVSSAEEAISFIQHHSKGHSEGIISENANLCDHFVASIDAAAVFVNCSTRFNDGAEFGLGAEMGIATGKLHARGPVGLREITTYKWVAQGSGQIRV
jgi:glutamate-5-semialdehyde dehydrogenase